MPQDEGESMSGLEGLFATAVEAGAATTEAGVAMADTAALAESTGASLTTAGLETAADAMAQQAGINPSTLGANTVVDAYASGGSVGQDLVGAGSNMIGNSGNPDMYSLQPKRGIVQTLTKNAIESELNPSNSLSVSKALGPVDPNAIEEGGQTLGDATGLNALKEPKNILDAVGTKNKVSMEGLDANIKAGEKLSGMGENFKQSIRDQITPGAEETPTEPTTEKAWYDKLSDQIKSAYDKGDKFLAEHAPDVREGIQAAFDPSKSILVKDKNIWENIARTALRGGSKLLTGRIAGKINQKVGKISSERKKKLAQQYVSSLK